MTSTTSTDLHERLATVVGIPVVPYDPEGRVDEERTARLADRLLDAGLTVITPNGNTGEFYALSPTERRRVLEIVAAARRPDTVVVAGVGLDLESAVADARHAAAHGAGAVMIHQPVVPYLSPDGWVEYNATIAAAVPDLAVLPYLSTRLVAGRHVAALAERAPNVVGLKYSVPDPVHFAAVRDDAGHDLLWIAGLAESWAPAYWQAGARGFTSGLVNVAPQVSFALLDALRAGDPETVARLSRQIRDFEALRARRGSADNVSVVKEAMHLAGLCDRSVRPPSHVLDEDAAREVRDAVAAWGMRAAQERVA
ncbi:dihydrodipicolinate synthase family protein [Isoptericola sp. NPDC019693]|uniref:dihydrodipicolinate synthase family protein n=1 Tax=Isoptericola sp. NPDC019693 TaxID=3364009 RepID=UPI0037B7EB01